VSWVRGARCEGGGRGAGGQPRWVGRGQTHLEADLQVLEQALVGELGQADHVIVAVAVELADEGGRITVLVLPKGLGRRVVLDLAGGWHGHSAAYRALLGRRACAVIVGL
jgi:hypothetical protein